MTRRHDQRAFLQRRVTFFRPPQDGSIQWGQCADWRVLAWSRSAIDPLQINGAGTLGECQVSLQKSMPGGGLIVAADVHHVSVMAVNAVAYVPPATMFCLDALGGTREIPLSSGIKYASGEHFLIPVDEAARHVLIQLRQNLKYLAPDQERTVLNAIARPIDILRPPAPDRTGPAAVPATVRAPSPATNPAIRPAVTPPVTASAKLQATAPQVPEATSARKRRHLMASAALLPLLMLWSVLALQTRGAKPVEKAGTQEAGPGAGAESLLAAMSGSPREVVRTLYQTHHLADYRGKPAIEEQSNFATAVVKLELLRLKLLSEDSGDLKSTDASNSVRVLQSRVNGLRLDGMHRDLLAHVNCRAFGSPSLLLRADIPGAGNCASVNQTAVGNEYLMLAGYAATN